MLAEALEVLAAAGGTAVVQAAGAGGRTQHRNHSLALNQRVIFFVALRLETEPFLDGLTASVEPLEEGMALGENGQVHALARVADRPPVSACLALAFVQWWPILATTTFSVHSRLAPAGAHAMPGRHHVDFLAFDLVAHRQQCE
ncbi:hypothetical protein ACFVHB_38425 [Kitasatospora sp. NPDC127111]|uniref:hypothetical protein n=1 Tax=Kitasatospora sp. NPDC127111 TaxID=3345363 RepID=UPI003642C032